MSMPNRPTKRQAELALRRARRAELLEKAQKEREKARKVRSKAATLRHEAEAIRLESEAYQIKLRKRTRKKRNKGLFEAVGDWV